MSAVPTPGTAGFSRAGRRGTRGGLGPPGVSDPPPLQSGRVQSRPPMPRCGKEFGFRDAFRSLPRATLQLRHPDTLADKLLWILALCPATTALVLRRDGSAAFYRRSRGLSASNHTAAREFGFRREGMSPAAGARQRGTHLVTGSTTPGVALRPGSRMRSAPGTCPGRS